MCTAADKSGAGVIGRALTLKPGVNQLRVNGFSYDVADHVVERTMRTFFDTMPLTLFETTAGPPAFGNQGPTL
jgi:hypothetical protein